MGQNISQQSKEVTAHLPRVMKEADEEYFRKDKTRK